MPTRDDRTVIATCSFCPKPNTDVATLVAGPGVFIWDGCIALAAAAIEGKSSSLPQIAPWEHEVPLEQVLANLAPVAAAGSQVEHNLAAWVSKARSLRPRSAAQLAAVSINARPKPRRAWLGCTDTWSMWPSPSTRLTSKWATGRSSRVDGDPGASICLEGGQLGE